MDAVITVFAIVELLFEMQRGAGAVDDHRPVSPTTAGAVGPEPPRRHAPLTFPPPMSVMNGRPETSSIDRRATRPVGGGKKIRYSVETPRMSARETAVTGYKWPQQNLYPSLLRLYYAQRAGCGGLAG